MDPGRRKGGAEGGCEEKTVVVEMEKVIGGGGDVDQEKDRGEKG